MTTFDQVFDGAIPKENYAGVYKDFVVFDLYLAAAAFPCVSCGKKTRWRWYSSSEIPATPTCGPECMEVIQNEDKEHEHNHVSDEGLGPECDNAIHNTAGRTADCDEAVAVCGPGKCTTTGGLATSNAQGA